jgi:hypothetical protein
VDLESQVVSNSIPLWLQMNGYQAPYGFRTAGFPLFPSMQSPDNFPPPYASVHVIPGSTMALAAAPRLSPILSHSQLVSERVRITMSGVRNDAAMDFVDFVNQYSLNRETFGIQNMAAVNDEQRGMSELDILAQRKVIEYQINYYQSRARSIARQLILQAVPTYILPQVSGS